MRPVDKGTNEKTFNEYTEAKGDLLDRLGHYCSYCERPGDLAVEHIEPKKKYPDKELLWENFLLGCNNCNGIKTDKDTQAERYFFPDEINTSHVFLYGRDARVQVNPALEPDEQEAAQRTLTLVGLDRVPPEDPRRRDQRWLKRDSAWRIAEGSLANLRRSDTDAMREQIVLTATQTGFFSVWMTVFADDTDMRRRFIEAFLGTHPGCFDVVGGCVPRLSLS
jgi:uncharacterized protein (TIGR02646 family)